MTERRFSDEENIEFSHIIGTMKEDELDDIKKRAFEAEVDAVAEDLMRVADNLAGYFDHYVVAAALYKVHQEYDAIIDVEPNDMDDLDLGGEDE